MRNKGLSTFLVANDAQKLLLGRSVRSFPVHGQPTARADRTRQMLQICQKLQCLANTSILTMIYTRSICVRTRNRSNGNPFLVCNRPFQLSTFPATASRVCEHESSAAEDGCARRKVGSFVRVIQNKHLIFLRTIFPLQLSIYQNCRFWCRFIQGKTFPVPDVNHAVVISESHLISFPRTSV